MEHGIMELWNNGTWTHGTWNNGTRIMEHGIMGNEMIENGT